MFTDSRRVAYSQSPIRCRKSPLSYRKSPRNVQFYSSINEWKAAENEKYPPELFPNPNNLFRKKEKNDILSSVSKLNEKNTIGTPVDSPKILSPSSNLYEKRRRNGVLRRKRIRNSSNGLSPSDQVDRNCDEIFKETDNVNLSISDSYENIDGNTTSSENIESETLSDLRLHNFINSARWLESDQELDEVKNIRLTNGNEKELEGVKSDQSIKTIEEDDDDDDDKMTIASTAAENDSLKAQNTNYMDNTIQKISNCTDSKMNFHKMASVSSVTELTSPLTEKILESGYDNDDNHDECNNNEISYAIYNNLVDDDDDDTHAYIKNKKKNKSSKLNSKNNIVDTQDESLAAADSILYSTTIDLPVDYCNSEYYYSNNNYVSYYDKSGKTQEENLEKEWSSVKENLTSFRQTNETMIGENSITTMHGTNKTDKRIVEKCDESKLAIPTDMTVTASKRCHVFDHISSTESVSSSSSIRDSTLLIKNEQGEYITYNELQTNTTKDQRDSVNNSYNNKDNENVYYDHTFNDDDVYHANGITSSRKTNDNDDIPVFPCLIDGDDTSTKTALTPQSCIVVDSIISKKHTQAPVEKQQRQEKQLTTTTTRTKSSNKAIIHKNCNNCKMQNPKGGQCYQLKPQITKCSCPLNDDNTFQPGIWYKLTMPSKTIKNIANNAVADTTSKCEIQNDECREWLMERLLRCKSTTPLVNDHKLKSSSDCNKQQSSSIMENNNDVVVNGSLLQQQQQQKPVETQTDEIRKFSIYDKSIQYRDSLLGYNNKEVEIQTDDISMYRRSNDVAEKETSIDESKKCDCNNQQQLETPQKANDTLTTIIGEKEKSTNSYQQEEEPVVTSSKNNLKEKNSELNNNQSQSYCQNDQQQQQQNEENVKKTSSQNNKYVNNNKDLKNENVDIKFSDDGGLRVQVNSHMGMKFTGNGSSCFADILKNLPVNMRNGGNCK